MCRIVKKGKTVLRMLDHFVIIPVFLQELKVSHLDYSLNQRKICNYNLTCFVVQCIGLLTFLNN